MENINMWMMVGSFVGFITIGILYVYLSNKIKQSKVFWRTKKHMNTFIDFVSFFAWFSPLVLWNPSGYSYYHIMKDFDYQGITLGFVAYVIPGAILTVIALWNLTSGWQASKFKGKVIYLVALVVTGMLGYASGLLGVMADFVPTWDNWSYFALLHMSGFMIWGSYFSRKERSKFAITRTDDVDNDEGAEDFDDQGGSKALI